MEVLRITVSAPVASFRRPLDHNYQRTLLLPPPTTLLGLAGAAWGLSEEELWASGSPLENLKVAVWIENKPGRARDMWTVMKIKGGKIADRSPYFRELLFFPRYTLIYGGPYQLLERLHQAFLDPVYPLSLGREDEMISIQDIALETTVSGTPLFRGTVIPGDLRQLKVRIHLQPGIRFEPPIIETLPLRFKLDRRGIRRPIQRTPLTFLPLELEVEVQDIKPVFALRGRNFTWMNS